MCTGARACIGQCQPWLLPLELVGCVRLHGNISPRRPGTPFWLPCIVLEVLAVHARCSSSIFAQAIQVFSRRDSSCTNSHVPNQANAIPHRLSDNGILAFLGSQST